MSARRRHRVRFVLVREDAAGRDRAVVLHLEERVPARVGDERAAAEAQDVDRVGVDGRVADHVVGVVVALEAPDVGDAVDGPVADGEQAAEAVGDRVLGGERVARDGLPRLPRSGSVGPPFVTYTTPCLTSIPCGPIALLPTSFSGVAGLSTAVANDASPSTTVSAAPGCSPSAPGIRATAPVAPTHAGPSALSKQDAVPPPLPASATYRSPLRSRSRWRGLCRPVASTVTPPGARW